MTEKDVESNTRTPPSGMWCITVDHNTRYYPANRNFAQILHEITGHLTFKKCFVNGKARMSVGVNGRIFEEIGSSYKTTKQALCERVLQNEFSLTLISETHQVERPTLDDGNQLAHIVEKLVLETFQQACSSSSHERFHVVAGVVLVRGSEMNVVGVTAGSGTIVGSNIEADGTVLIDCHAEVLARRCAVRYLYTELSRHLSSSGDAASRPTGQPALFAHRRSDSGRLRLRSDVSFHLYCSQPPCGNAACFGLETDAHPNRKSRDLLRVKLECGQGTPPAPSQPIDQSLSALKNRGERLQLMSCSDKLQKWVALGFQGAALSNLIDPVHFSCQLNRSCRRLPINSWLKPVFPKMFRGSSAPTHVDLSSHASQNCVNLIPSEPLNPSAPFEIIHAAQGLAVRVRPGKRKLDGTFTNSKTTDFLQSRLSKNSIHMWYQELGRAVLRSEPELTYSQAKASAVDYQAGKQILYNHFSSSGLRTWVTRSEHLDDFLFDRT